MIHDKAVTASLTRQLAEFAALIEYDALPPDVVLTAKRLTLDTLGTALAATTLGDGCREVVEVMSALGGKPESTILGQAIKVSAPNAAFANGALAHALNYDAAGGGAGHIGVVCLAAPLAIAESVAPVSGRRFLTAVVAAAEVSARVYAAAMKGKRHISELLLAGQYFGYFGAAAGAGQLLGLNPAAMHSAFGIALMQVAGTQQISIGGDTPAKAVYGGFPNQGGLVAALLARAGLGAEIDVLEGAAGFYGLAAAGRYDSEVLTADLGTRFRLLDTQFKLWPTSAVVAPFIEAAIDLATRYDLRIADIAAVEIAGPQQIRRWCEPIEERRRPPNAASAANSALFGVGKALANRRVVLADFTPEGLRDQDALALTDRVIYRIDDDIEGGAVAIRTTDGQELIVCVPKPLGDPSRPLPADRLEAKFRDCSGYAMTLRPCDAEALIDSINHLEEVDDVSCLARPADLVRESKH